MAPPKEAPELAPETMPPLPVPVEFELALGLVTGQRAAGDAKRAAAKIAPPAAWPSMLPAPPWARFPLSVLELIAGRRRRDQGRRPWHHRSRTTRSRAAGLVAGDLRVADRHGVDRSRAGGREHVGNAATVSLAAQPGLRPVAAQGGAAHGEHAGVKIAIGGGVEIAQVIEDAAPRAEVGENGTGAACRVVLAAADQVAADGAAADVDGASCIRGDAAPGAGANQGRDASRLPLLFSPPLALFWVSVQLVMVSDEGP